MPPRVLFLVLSCSYVLALGAGCAKDPPRGEPAGPDPGPDPAASDAGTDLASAPRVGTVALPSAGARDMPPLAFGQNYWNWELAWGDAVTGTETLVKAAGVKLIRAGGFNNDVQTPGAFDNTQLDRFAAYCKAVGAEPVLQVPLITNAAGSAGHPRQRRRPW